MAPASDPAGDAAGETDHANATSSGADEGGLETQLRIKIQSKIDVAKVLGGVIGLTLGWVVTNERIADGDVTIQLAVVALLVSLLLYLATIDAYDTLLMPQKFWNKSARTRCPSTVIHEKMIRVWRGLFLPATGAVLIGLLLLVWPLINSDWPAPAALAAGTVLAVALYIHSRPAILPRSKDH